MTISVLFACMAGILVGLSRQFNGRLSLSTSPLIASFWNHIIGFGVLIALGLLAGGLFPVGAFAAPWHAYLGGPIGVVFVAAVSWVIARIGAVNTALMIISGQMVSGVMLDLLRSKPISLWESILGVALIIAGIVVAQRRGKTPAQKP